MFHLVNIYNDFQCNVLLYFSFFVSFSPKKNVFLFVPSNHRKEIIARVLFVVFLCSKGIETLESNAFVLILFTFHLSNKCLNFCWHLVSSAYSFHFLYVCVRMREIQCDNFYNFLRQIFTFAMIKGKIERNSLRIAPHWYGAKLIQFACEVVWNYYRKIIAGMCINSLDLQSTNIYRERGKDRAKYILYLKQMNSAEFFSNDSMISTHEKREQKRNVKIRWRHHRQFLIEFECWVVSRVSTSTFSL